MNNEYDINADDEELCLLSQQAKFHKVIKRRAAALNEWLNKNYLIMEELKNEKN